METLEAADGGNGQESQEGADKPGQPSESTEDGGNGQESQEGADKPRQPSESTEDGGDGQESQEGADKPRQPSQSTEDHTTTGTLSALDTGSTDQRATGSSD